MQGDARGSRVAKLGGERRVHFARDAYDALAARGTRQRQQAAACEAAACLTACENRSFRHSVVKVAQPTAKKASGWRRKAPMKMSTARQK